MLLEIMKFYVGNGFWAWLGLTVAGFVILSVVSETIIQLIKSITTIIRGYPNTCKCKETEEPKEDKKEKKENKKDFMSVLANAKTTAEAEIRRIENGKKEWKRFR